MEGLDTVVTAETPEGILLELRPAGLSVRLYAFLFDWLIRLVIIYIASIFLVFFRGIGFGVMLVLVALVFLGQYTPLGALKLPVAVSAHEGSTVVVILNGLRLLGGRRPRITPA